MKASLTTAVIALIGAVSAAPGGTVSFVGVGPSTVPPGTPVHVDVFVSADSIGGIATVDAIIGSDDAADLSFSYDATWVASFSNITPVTPDIGFYAQDLFVGGNNGGSGASVGTSLLVGRLTVSTNGLPEGTYRAVVNSGIDDGVSSLTFGGEQELLQGEFFFTVECAAADADCDGRVSLIDAGLLAPCMTGPGQPADAVCSASDADGDTDVDLADVALLAQTFTGN